MVLEKGAQGQMEKSIKCHASELRPNPKPWGGLQRFFKSSGGKIRSEFGGEITKIAVRRSWNVHTFK